MQLMTFATVIWIRQLRLKLIKHLQINKTPSYIKFKNKFLKKLCFSLWMDCKFELNNNLGFFWKSYNFVDIWQMQLMTFATVLKIRQLRFKIIYRYELWQMRHMTYDITQNIKEKSLKTIYA